MRYLFFVLALLSGILFGPVAYAEPGNDYNNGRHEGDCKSNPGSADYSGLCDDPGQ